MTSTLPPGGTSLLGVFAHPDDESLACGGLLAQCAEAGVRVTLLCATGGEHGPGPTTGPAASPAGLRETRVRELRAATRALGVADLIVLEHEDGMLPWTDAERLEQDIEDAIRRTHADIVITFDEDGLYWHPDHIAVHQRTTAVVARLGHDGPALYYASLPRDAMRAVVQHAADTWSRHGERGAAPSLILGVDADAFGALAPSPTLIIDAGDIAPRKLAALACHRTQMAGSALALVTERDAARLLGVEHYRRAPVGAAGDNILERLGAARPVAGRHKPSREPCTNR